MVKTPSHINVSVRFHDFAPEVPCQCHFIAEVREDERRYTVHTINVREPVAEHTLEKLKAILAPRLVVNVVGTRSDFQ